MTPEPRRIVLVEDHEQARKHLKNLLQMSGFYVDDYADATTALTALGIGPVPEAVLTDLMLPDRDGREVLRLAASLSPRPFLGLMSGWPIEDETVLRAEGLVDRVYLKPIDLRILLASLPAG